MKKALPVLLLVGAAAAVYYFMRKRTESETKGRTFVTAEPLEKITEEQFYAAEPTLLDKATNIVKNVFSTPKQRMAAKKSQAIAVRRAQAKGIKRETAKKVVKALERPAFLRGISDDNVLC
jgi:hypothetical protein